MPASPGSGAGWRNDKPTGVPSSLHRGPVADSPRPVDQNVSVVRQFRSMVLPGGKRSTETG